MPRPHKKRCISQKPKCSRFNPQGYKSNQAIILTLDEFETIRWIDAEGLSQENCASVMNISRTTVQRLYVSARKSIADALVNGYSLEITGGNVDVRAQAPFNRHINEKGELNMRIAIGFENELVSMHFGQCNNFRLIDIEDGKAVKSEDIHDDVSVHQERPQFLKNLGVDVLILGGLGRAAYNRLLALGIECIDGSGKSVEAALEAYLNKTLDKPLLGHASCANDKKEKNAGDHACGGHHHHDHHHNHHTNGGKGRGKS